MRGELVMAWVLTMLVVALIAGWLEKQRTAAEALRATWLGAMIARRCGGRRSHDAVTLERTTRLLAGASAESAEHPERVVLGELVIRHVEPPPGPCSRKERRTARGPPSVVCETACGRDDNADQKEKTC